MVENEPQQEAELKPVLVHKDKKPLKFFTVLIGFLILVFGLSYAIHFASLYFFCKNGEIDKKVVINPFGDKLDRISFNVDKFTSKEEFIEYIKSSETETPFLGVPLLGSVMEQTLDLGAVTDSVGRVTAPSGAGAPSRVSTTNVQVVGIDEPDIVKTDGERIFASTTSLGIRPLPLLEETDSDIMPMYPIPVQNTTKIIQAFPPSELEKIGGIDKIGNLLLNQDVLVIFSIEEVFGYDVSDPKNPTQIWNIPYQERTSYKDARLYEGQIYLITRTNLNRHDPCPFVPITQKGESISIPCVEVYHPRRNVPIDVTYTIFKIDTKTGSLEDSISFVGSSNDAIIYMSPDNLYLSYSYREDYTKIYLDFIKTSASDLFSEEFIGELEELTSYDLSSQVKLMELMHRIEEYIASLSEDEAMRVSNELSNKLDNYNKEHPRDFETTGIVRIKRSNLSIDATGIVPGHPLNQFSLDEYEDNLRIATNSGGSIMFGTVGDVNDVYILNSNLKEIGKVTDLGQDERIYAARFIEDRGYIVTFKEIDPFYVLDLSNPKDPQMKGELKIPGYSSYLHPLRKNIILGIGKEGSQVKLSIFDVSNPESPEELDKYILEEYWSEIINNHHAFLLDPKHEIFFLPGSKGGYIFSYGDDKLSLKKTESSVNVKRAVYIDDYLFIITQDKIIVINENTWNNAGELKYSE